MGVECEFSCLLKWDMAGKIFVNHYPDGTHLLKHMFCRKEVDCLVRIGLPCCCNYGCLQQSEDGSASVIQ